MSYGEELMTEMLIAEALEEQDRKDQVCRFYGAIGAKVWITSDGSSISIRKMIAVISEIASQCSRGICRFMMSLSIGSP